MQFNIEMKKVCRSAIVERCLGTELLLSRERLFFFSKLLDLLLARISVYFLTGMNVWIGLIQLTYLACCHLHRNFIPLNFLTTNYTSQLN